MDVVIAISILFFATLIRATFGFADALVGMPLLLLFFNLPTADVLMSSTSLLIGLILSSLNIKIILENKKELVPLISGAILGLIIGILSLHYIPHHLLLYCLAGLLILYPLLRIANHQYKLKNQKPAPLIGLISGFFGAAFSINGPFYVIYGQLRQWPRKKFIALLQPLFLLGNCLSLIGYGTSGFIQTNQLIKLALAIPFILLAIYLGSHLQKIIAKRFHWYVILLIFISGLTMLYKLL